MLILIAADHRQDLGGGVAIRCVLRTHNLFHPGIRGEAPPAAFSINPGQRDHPTAAGGLIGETPFGFLYFPTVLNHKPSHY
jgi:hypothetical protein